MKKLTCVLCVLSLFLFAGALSAGEKKLMHCFAFTVIDGASDADWQAFFKATDALPGKIPGLSKVWYGKLARPMAVYYPDAETRRGLKPDTKTVTGNFSRSSRQWGVCMEFADDAALKAYAPHPAHKDWEAVYSKVRQPGTTTFDFLGQ